MKINIVTLFPNMVKSFISESIISRALNKEIIEINIYNYRDYTEDKHKKVDDTPYGGGAGMLMKVEPVEKTLKFIEKIEDLSKRKSYIVYMSPKGSVYNQEKALELLNYKEITILCGHYEGIDERIIENYVDEEISIGDYVLTGGEIPAMCLVDSITRLLNEAINKDSLVDESFSNYLLEYPQYTKPADYKGLKVPDILLSGHHENIKNWRITQSENITKVRRPDLYEKYVNSKFKV